MLKSMCVQHLLIATLLEMKLPVYFALKELLFKKIQMDLKQFIRRITQEMLLYKKVSLSIKIVMLPKFSLCTFQSCIFLKFHLEVLLRGDFEIFNF